MFIRLLLVKVVVVVILFTVLGQSDKDYRVLFDRNNPTWHDEDFSNDPNYCYVVDCNFIASNENKLIHDLWVWGWHRARCESGLPYNHFWTCTCDREKDIAIREDVRQSKVRGDNSYKQKHSSGNAVQEYKGSIEVDFVSVWTPTSTPTIQPTIEPTAIPDDDDC